MSIQQKVQLVSNNRLWSEVRRYKVNAVVSYDGENYQNISGKNSIPSDLIDWVKIGGDLGNFIPLSGTEVGEPVTGDIELQDEIKLKGTDSWLSFEGDIMYFKNSYNNSSFNASSSGFFMVHENVEDEIVSLQVSNPEIVVSGNAKGIIGTSFFDKQDDPNAFAQLGDIDTITGDFIDSSEKGQALGVATLDSGGKVPLAQINDALIGSVNYQGNYNASTNTPTLPTATGNKGKYYVVNVAGTQEGLTLTNGDWIISNGTIWEKIDSNNEVTSVAGKTGAVTLVIADISTLQSVLDAKFNQGGNAFGTTALIGSTDNNDVSVVRNGTAYMTFQTGDAYMFRGNGILHNAGTTYSSLKFGASNGSTPLSVTRNRSDTVTVFAVDNLNSTSTGNLIDLKNQGTTVAGTRVDGRTFGTNGTSNNDFSTIIQVKSSVTIIADLTVAINVANLEAYYGLTGSGALASLPPISGNSAKKITIANKSAGSVSIFSNDGTSSDIWNAGTATNTVSLSSGNVISLFNDGVNWVITSKN